MHLLFALRLAVGGLALGIVAAFFGAGDLASSGLAQGSMRSFIPMAPRAGLARPVSFGMAMPGPGVVLSGSPTAARSAAQVTQRSVPAYADIQSFDLSYDGSLQFELRLAGDLEQAPPGGSFSFHFIGRPAHVTRSPHAMMEPPCQVSPTSDPKTFAVLFSGFPGNELVDVRINQIGGDEVFFVPRPVTIGPYGDGNVTFNFFSDQTKDWLVTGTARANRIISATTTFRTSVNQACPPPGAITEPPPAEISDGPLFFANSSFDVRVTRTDGAWEGEVRRWNRGRWAAISKLIRFSVSERTVRMSVPPGDIGVTPNGCVQFGGMSRVFPTSGSPFGKPVLLDDDRGPLGSFCTAPDSGALSAGGPGGGPIAVQAWIGCGGSDAGLNAPPCSSPQLAGRSAAQAPTVPTLIGVSSSGVSPSVCTPQAIDATMCPPVGMDIWIAPDGTASLQPYENYGPFTWVVTTNPPLPGGGVKVEVFRDDYNNVIALQHLPMHFAEYQSLLHEYVGTWAVEGIGPFDASGTGSYTYSGVQFSKLYNYMVCTRRGLFEFSQLPLTFHTGGSATKFIIDIGVKYEPAYRCA